MTYDQYLEVEEKYWRTLYSILEDLSVSNLLLSKVSKPYLYMDTNSLVTESFEFCQQARLKKGMKMQVNLQQFKGFFQAAMREVFWFDVNAENATFVDFGDDFYLFCGSNLDFKWEKIDGIFVEEMKSPLWWRT